MEVKFFSESPYQPRTPKKSKWPAIKSWLTDNWGLVAIICGMLFVFVSLAIVHFKL